MTIDADRLRHDLQTLAGFGATPEGGVSRPSFSPADRDARRWVAGRCEQAGLAYREDAAGNVFIRVEAQHPIDDRTVWTGSHLDSVPNGGPLDGALGVMASLEVVRALKESAAPLRRAVEAVAFTDEEGAYLGFLGSRAAIDGLGAGQLDAVRGRDGDRLVEAMAAAGYPPSALPDARVDPARIAAYVELHIEQGAVLEQLGRTIGLVTHIVGVGRGSVVFEGRADHAGTTPMHLRRDAMRGAAALLTELPALPAAVGAPDAVVTCGRIDVDPGADNIVPERVHLHLDIRDRDRGTIEAIEAELRARAARHAHDHGLRATYHRSSLTDPVPLHPRLQRYVAQAAESAGLAYHVMPSGAGHDAQVVAAAVPTGMLFVPSAGGRSHSPQERTRFEDIAAGTRVLYDVVRRLATDEHPPSSPAPS